MRIIQDMVIVVVLLFVSTICAQDQTGIITYKEELVQKKISQKKKNRNG